MLKNSCFYSCGIFYDKFCDVTVPSVHKFISFLFSAYTRDGNLLDSTFSDFDYTFLFA